MPGAYRAHSAFVGVGFIMVGLALMGIGVALRIAPAATVGLSWLCIVGGGLYLIVAVFAIGLALGTRDVLTCPHCSNAVDARVGLLGRLSLVKPPPSK